MSRFPIFRIIHRSETFIHLELYAIEVPDHVTVDTFLARRPSILVSDSRKLIDALRKDNRELINVLLITGNF